MVWFPNHQVMGQRALSLPREDWPSLGVVAGAPRGETRWSHAGSDGTETAKQQIRRQTLYFH